MSDDNSGESKELTFWEHLGELIERLRRILYALVISSVASMLIPIDPGSISLSLTDPWYPTLTTVMVRKVQEDLLPGGTELLPLRWTAPLEVYLYASIVLAILVSSPVIAYEVYKFVNPALYERERKLMSTIILSFVGLFAFGVLFGYSLIIPATLRILLLSADLLGLPPTYEFSQFYSFVFGALLTSGFFFTFPIYFVLSVKLGFLRAETVSKNRKYLYAALIIITAIITPDPTLVSDILLLGPIVLLTEVSILVARRVEPKATGPVSSKASTVGS